MQPTDPTLIPQQPEQLEPVLEHLLVATTQKADETNQILEAMLQQNEKNNPEQTLEAQLLVLDKIAKKDAITNIRIEMDGVDHSEITGPMGPQGPEGKAGRNGLDGKNGRDGMNGKDGITPVNGKDYNTDPEKVAFANSILAHIKVPKNGKDGKNAINGTNGKDGVNGKDGKDGADGNKITTEEILKKIEGKLPYDYIKDVPNFRGRASKTTSLLELDDVDLSGLTKTNGKYILGSGSGAVTSVFGRTGTVTAQVGDYTTAIVADSSNKRYVTDAQLTIIGNTSGTNTGDETTSTIKTKLGITTLSGSNTGDQDLSGLLVKANNLLELTSASSARTNLGLGTLATQSGTFSGTSSGTNTGDQNLSGYAPLASPTFTGDVTMPGTGIWNSSGSVGIGTLSPAVKFQVTAGLAGKTIGTTNIANFGLSNNGGTSWPQFFTIGVGTYTTDINNPSTRVDFKLKASADGTETGAVTVMTLLDSGNVGIGNTAPSAKLDVAGNLVVTSSSANALAVGPNGKTTPLFNVDASTASAVEGLVLTGAVAGGTTLLATNSAGMNGSLTIKNTALGKLALNSNQSGGSVAIQIAGTDKLNITSATSYFSNNVGIGQTTPTAILHLKAGTATANTASLKIPSGTVLTTPEAGAVDADNSTIYWTNSSAVRLPLTTGYVLNFTHASTNPADATTSYFGVANSFTQTETLVSVPIPKSGTIKAIYLTGTAAGTLGSSETSTLSLRLNHTTDIVITSSMVYTALQNNASATGLSTAVSAGDTVQIKWVTPTWATNPTSVFHSVNVYIE